MKCEIIIDANCEEKVVIYANEINELVNKIKKAAEEINTEIVGYKDREIKILSVSEIYLISIVDNKTYAICENEEWQLKERLYTTEEKLPDYFVKINQSSIVNINKIEKFDTSISGTLKICLKNGHTDYVSRRQLKFIKERIGI